MPPTSEQLVQAKRRETEKGLGLAPGALDLLDTSDARREVQRIAEHSEEEKKNSPVSVEVAAPVELPGTQQEAL